MQTVHRIVLALGLAAVSASSFATTTVYTTSASFLPNVAAGAFFNNFDGLPEDAPTSYSGGGFSYTLSSAEGIYGSGDFVGTNQPDLTLTITFGGTNVRAVGANFYATNISDTFQSVSMTVTLNDGTTVSFTPTSAAANSFRGFVSTTPITSLVISAPGASLYAGLDNLTVGSAVPEPAAAVLMLLGVAGIVAARQRKA